MNYEAGMRLALVFAQTSPDPSTQNGAAIVRSRTGAVLVGGCNAFPKGVAEPPERWKRPAKYQFVEHAERAAIYEAARRGVFTRGATMCCPWAACPDCARAIVMAGIIRLVRYPLQAEGHWAEPVRVGDTILREGGVEIIEDAFPGLEVPPLRRNGALWVFDEVT